jgi:hypothetical protein
MRTTTARAGGLVAAIVLGSMLVSPPSYAAKSLSVTCNALGGEVAFPSGTATVAVTVALSNEISVDASRTVSPKRAASVQLLNETNASFVSVSASALSQTGKVLASGSANC